MLGFLPHDIGLLVSASDPRLSPDASHVAFSVVRIDLENNRYHSRVWVAATDGTGPAQPLSPDDLSASTARWSPDGTQLAYTARPLADDDALSEIVVVKAGGGDPIATIASPTGPSEIEWSPDGTRVAFVARVPDPERYGAPGETRKDKDMSPRRVDRLFTRIDNTGWISDRPSRAFVAPADGSEPARAITTGPFDVSGIAWAPDSNRLAFASARHDTWDLDCAVDLWVVDATVEGAEPQRVTETGAAYSLPSWSPDGTRLACHRAPSDIDGPWHGQVAVVPAGGGAAQVLTADLDRNCTPYPAARAPQWQGESLLFLLEERGHEHVWRAESTQPGSCEPVITGDRVISGVDAVDDVLAFVASAPATGPELFVVRGGRETQLSDFTAELTAAGRQVAVAQPFTATSADGTEVDCWIIEPEHAAGTRAPLLLNIHGGPFTQYGNRLFDEFQVEAGAGFGVLFCNPRGSSGYSQAWGRSIRWPECKTDAGSGWGGVDYDDLMAAVAEAERRFDWVDPERIGAIGGSYGGYMTSWMIGHTDRFAAVVSERSVNNLLTLEHASDVAGTFISYVGVRHIDDPEPYLRQSPITYVREMNTPLLILHSESDLRCPVNQAEELFVALRLLGRTPEFVRFPGEGHELSRSGAPRHRVQRAEIVLDFFRRHLGS